MRVLSSFAGGLAPLDMLNSFLNDRAALPHLHRHTYLIDDFGILRHVPALVPKHFEIQLYGFTYVPEGLFHRLALRVAAGQCRDFNPEPAFFGCMNYD